MKRGNEIQVKKKHLILAISLFIFAIAVLFSQSVLSVGETTYCCERTIDGAWCQSSPPSTCDENYRSVPTSCESTAYCKLGTCIDSLEGTCLPNVPQSVCEGDQGVWKQEKVGEILQCQLGCCILGDEAAFVTQTACKRLSADYGLETNYRTDINDEISCIASAGADVKGACVFDKEFERTCELTTKSNCQDKKAQLGDEANVEFHEGFLCSAESLATNCGPSEKTTCVETRDEVYFLDTCGNLANIYDSTKINDKEYWKMIYEKSESCNPNSANANSESCGNCNYLAGSTCKSFESGDTARPNYGDYICKDLACEYEGERYEHGERWCDTSSRVKGEDDLPGTEHYRLSCYNNEVIPEKCDSFRNQYCAETTIETNKGDFSFATCKVNLWVDCVLQENKKDCEDIEARDCRWLEGETNAYFRDDEGKKYVVNKNGELVPEEDSKSEKQASCVPEYAPGFDFYEENTNATKWCEFANDFCLVKYEKNLVGGALGISDWECKENCWCVEDKKEAAVNKIEANSEWVTERNELCVSLGDCGSSVNYIDVQGEENGDAVTVIRGSELEE